MLISSLTAHFASTPEIVHSSGSQRIYLYSPWTMCTHFRSLSFPFQVQVEEEVRESSFRTSVAYVCDLSRSNKGCYVARSTNLTPSIKQALLVQLRSRLMRTTCFLMRTNKHRVVNDAQFKVLPRRPTFKLGREGSLVANCAPQECKKS